jgi:hypothetical protein
MWPGDKIVVLAEDDNSYDPSTKLPDLDDEEEMVPGKPAKALLEKLLFCGWRRDLHSLIACLDDFVHPGTTFAHSPVIRMRWGRERRACQRLVSRVFLKVAIVQLSWNSRPQSLCYPQDYRYIQWHIDCTVILGEEVA